MAANTSPIFALTPNIGINQAILTANTTTDLTGGTIYLLFTAGANGSWLEEIRCKAKGTNVQSLIRFWLNNGSTTATNTNNAFFDEYSPAATTASNIFVQPWIAVNVRKALPAGWRVYATLATGVAAGYDTVAFGGDY